MISGFVHHTKVPTWVRYVSVSIDIVALTLYNASDTFFNAAMTPVSTATLLLYPLLILLAALRMDRVLVAYATLSSLVAMNLLWLAAWPHFDPAMIPRLASADPLGEVYRSLYVLGFGVIVSFMPRTIRRLLETQNQVLNRERNARVMARRDQLTGLANRTGLEEGLAVALSLSDRTGMGTALIFIDLDSFKPVNDQWGHQVGDDVLIRTARRIEENLRGSDFAARIGGDEFVVVAQAVDDPQAAMILAERILEAIRQPYLIGDQTISLGASLGVALYPDEAGDAIKLLELADQAMYRIKHGQKNGVARAGADQPFG
jgi:diguanylate cyclase (GGDEF)-like protein